MHFNQQLYLKLIQTNIENILIFRGFPRTINLNINSDYNYLTFQFKRSRSQKVFFNKLQCSLTHE